MAALGDKNIRRLDVAVDDAFDMRGVERVGDLDRQSQQHIGFNGAAGDAVLQRHAIQKFHDDESLAMLVVNFVDGADVGMIQRGGGLRLALETGQGLRILGNFFRQKFERDEAVQLQVLGLVDDAHPATTELLDDAVVRDGLADHGLAGH